MKTIRFLTIVSATLIAIALATPPADAQSSPQNATQTATQTKRKPAARPSATAAASKTTLTSVALNPPVAPPPPSPLGVPPVEQKCLRALNGECTNPLSVEAARLRAEIIPAVRLSYFGTPAGTTACKTGQHRFWTA